MESAQKPKSIQNGYRKSWITYIKPLITFIILSSIGVVFYLKGYPEVCVGVQVLAVILCGYNVLYLRSVFLFTNEKGVWIYRGILPWSKGLNGVKWRDLEDANYVTNFWSWILKSYTVRVGHRFTKSSEILLSNIARGDLAVKEINSLHDQYLSMNKTEPID